MCISLHLLVICCVGNSINNNPALYYFEKLHVSIKGLNIMHANNFDMICVYSYEASGPCAITIDCAA